VEVRHGFAAVRAIIDHEPKPVAEFETAGQGSGGEEEVAEHGLVLGARRAHARDGHLGDDEQVDRGLRLDVVDSDAVLVLVFDPCRNLAGDDALKKGRHRCGLFGELVPAAKRGGSPRAHAVGAEKPVARGGVSSGNSIMYFMRFLPMAWARFFAAAVAGVAAAASPLRAQDPVLEAYGQEPSVIRARAKSGIVRAPLGTAVGTDGLSARYPAGTAVRLTSPESEDIGTATVFHGWAPTAFDAVTGFAAADTSNPLNIVLTNSRRLVGFRGHPYAVVLQTPNREWRSGGDALWTGTYDVFAPTGEGTARGTSLSAAGELTYLETTVTAPARVLFHWRLDAASGTVSTLKLLRDGTEVLNYATSGSARDRAGWQPETLTLEGSGPVRLRFVLQRTTTSTLFPNPLGQEAAYLGTFLVNQFEAPRALRITSTQPTGLGLSWTRGLGPVDHTVEVANDAAFTQIVNTQVVPGILGSTAFVGGLTQGQTYYARVIGTRPGVPLAQGSSAPIVFVAGTAKQNQTLTPNLSSPRAFTAAPITLAATASSGLPVAYAMLSGPATLVGNQLTVAAPGTVRLRFTQAGDLTYNPVEDEVTVVFTGRSQTVTFAALTNRTASAAPLRLSASASSGLPVSFEFVSGPATLGADGRTLTLTREEGVVMVRAVQPGGVRNNVAYGAAPPITRSFTVTAAVNASQTIAFAPPTKVTYGDAPLGLVASASSGLGVSFELRSGPAVLEADGVTLRFTGAGEVTLRARQAGGRVAAVTYRAAQLDRTLVVQKRRLFVSGVAAERLVNQANPPLTLTYEGFAPGDTEAVLDAPRATRPRPSVAATSTSRQGLYPITYTGGSHPNYSFAVSPTTGALLVRGFGGTYEALLKDGFTEELIGKVVIVPSSTKMDFTGTLHLAAEGKSSTLVPFTPPGSTRLTATEDLLSASGVATLSLRARTSPEDVARDAVVYAVRFTVDVEGRMEARLYEGATLAEAVSDSAPAVSDLGIGGRRYTPPKGVKAPWEGSYTALFTDAAGLAFEPQPRGAGYATVKIDAAGKFSLTGRLADDRVVTATLYPDDAGRYRLLANPYGSELNSYFAGDLALVPHPNPAPGRTHRIVASDDTALLWRARKSQHYPNGFGPLEVRVSLDPWLAPVTASTRPPRAAITLAQRLGVTASNTADVQLNMNYGISDLGDRALELPGSLTLLATNKTRFDTNFLNVAKWKLTVLDLATGRFEATFELADLNPTTGRTALRSILVRGALRQVEGVETGTTLGAGYYVLKPLPQAAGQPSDPTETHEFRFEAP
jgi:hypothetical protein